MRCPGASPEAWGVAPGNVLLPEEWRLLSGMSAAKGLLIFGLMTAMLVKVLCFARLEQESGEEEAHSAPHPDPLDEQIRRRRRSHGFFSEQPPLAQLRMPACRIASRIAAFVPSVRPTSGIRTSSEQRPSSDRPYFAPASPGSRKIASWSGISLS